MVFENIEKLKQDYTDKYVVVDASRPELRRFRHLTGVVKTVNMNGRALVEFNGNENIGWYDIELDFLKVVDKPQVAETPAKAVAKAAVANRRQRNRRQRNRRQASGQPAPQKKAPAAAPPVAACRSPISWQRPAAADARPAGPGSFTCGVRWRPPNRRRPPQTGREIGRCQVDECR